MSRYFYATTQDNQMLRVRSTAIRERICWAHDATPITGHDARATPLTHAQQMRFAADCRAAGVTAFFLPVKEPDGESATTTRK